MALSPHRVYVDISGCNSLPVALGPLLERWNAFDRRSDRQCMFGINLLIALLPLILLLFNELDAASVVRIGDSVIR